MLLYYKVAFSKFVNIIMWQIMWQNIIIWIFFLIFFVLYCKLSINRGFVPAFSHALSEKDYKFIYYLLKYNRNLFFTKYFKGFENELYIYIYRNFYIFSYLSFNNFYREKAWSEPLIFYFFLFALLQWFILEFYL